MLVLKLLVFVILGAVILIATAGLLAIAAILYWLIKEGKLDLVGLPSYDPKAEYRERKRWILERIENNRNSDVESRQVRPGTMPMSIRCRGSVFRYHREDLLYRGDEFWKTFLDGPWKWSAQQRYAGKDKNPGHYFAFFRESARNELLHYSNDIEKYRLLELDGALDDVLDLTSVHHIQKVAEATGSPWPGWGTLLSQLVARSNGGAVWTDIVGLYAYTNSYKGLIFYSARTIDTDTLNAIQERMPTDEEGVELFVLENMWAGIHRMCLVIFSGDDVLRATKRYRVDEGDWIDNPYFGMTKAELDSELGYHPEYQLAEQLRERKGRVAQLRSDALPVGAQERGTSGPPPVE